MTNDPMTNDPMTNDQFQVAYLSFGSNKGKREHFLRDALKVLSDHPAIAVTQVSQIYETEPWGKGGQPWFLNQVIQIKTGLTPERLLKLCQSIEAKGGRPPRRADLPSEKWGPREIDVDILLYGNKILRLPELEVPHPHLHERRFMLVPLVEIAPSLRDPVSGKALKRALQELRDPSQVKFCEL